MREHGLKRIEPRDEAVDSWVARVNAAANATFSLAFWKPKPSIDLGVREVRVNVGTAQRVFYVVKDMRALDGV